MKSENLTAFMPDFDKAEIFDFLENGYMHTEALKKADAIEMMERYQRTFPFLEFSLVPSVIFVKAKK